MKVTNSQLWEIVKREDDKDSMADYMHGLGYDAVLDVEAMMMYGREIVLYGEDAEPLATCIDDVQASWGGNKGDIELAINYMLEKDAFTDYLVAAIDAL